MSAPRHSNDLHLFAALCSRRRNRCSRGLSTLHSLPVLLFFDVSHDTPSHVLDVLSGSDSKAILRVEMLTMSPHLVDKDVLRGVLVDVFKCIFFIVRMYFRQICHGSHGLIGAPTHRHPVRRLELQVFGDIVCTLMPAF